MVKKPFSFWQNVVFTDETTRMRISSDGIARVFLEVGPDFLKSTKNFEFGHTIFQQDNAPVYKSKIIGNFLSSKGVECTGMASMQSRSQSYRKFMGDFEATITKTEFFGKKSMKF